MKKQNFTSKLINFAAVAIITAALFGCKAKQKIVERTKLKTEYIMKTDTLMKHDSVYNEVKESVYTKNDTIIIERQIYKYKYNDVKHIVNLDTIINANDTITVEQATNGTMTQGNERVGGVLILIVLVFVLMWICYKKTSKI